MTRVRHGAAVLALLGVVGTGCQGSDKGGTPPPPPPPTTLEVVTRGGSGTVGAGGAGGSFVISAWSGSDIRILASGQVDASFHQNLFAPDLGANPLTVSAPVSLRPDPLTNTLVGDDGATAATGLWVKPGVTLTLEPNADHDWSAGDDAVLVELAASAFVEGTLAVARRNGAGPDAANLELYAKALVVTGAIELSGDAAAEAPGGDGGRLWVQTDGGIQLAGAIRSRGGDGSEGGDGGELYVESALHGLWNTGVLDSSGGAGATGAGGQAGPISLYGSGDPGGLGSWGGAFTSGAVTARGGTGAAGGGDGGYVYVAGYYNGSAVSSSDVDSSGGDATVDGDGGSAGGVEIDCWTGELRVTGRLLARGGRGAGAGAGGDGSDLYFGLWDDDQTFGGLWIGAARIGAAMDTSGGDGATGGRGGAISLDVSPSWVYEPGAHVVELAGYGAIVTSGGDGAAGGGAGGEVSLFNDLGEGYSGGRFIGGVRVEVPVTTAGGAGGEGAGGQGGAISLATYFVADPDGSGENGVPSHERSVEVTAPLVASGGDGADGGSGGAIFVYDRHLASTVALTSRGGRGASGAGGAGGSVQALSDRRAEVVGAVSVSGGEGATQGGAGGSVDVWGLLARLEGDVSADGGASTGQGGAGGAVALLATGDAASLSGTVSVRGGAGSPAGATGTFRLDGIPVQLADGSFTR